VRGERLGDEKGRRTGMDGQRFDELARALGTGASRRRVLKGLFAGLAAAGLQANRAFAQETCDTDEDCAIGETCIEGVCQAVCAGETEVCESGDECCDGLICVQEGGPGTCQLPGACQEIDEGCSGVAPCCDGLACVDNVCVEACAAEDVACETNDDCCDDLVCRGGEMGGGTCVPPGTCQELGEGCAGVAPCCDGLACIDNVCVEDAAPELTPVSTPPVTSLPNTGAGGSGDSSAGIGAAAAIGGAAALLAAKKLLETKGTEKA
jgi:hypothetical protein